MANGLENKKMTISDVAEALRVSKTTVSRAISGKGRISEDTRQKVLDYIEANDYKPNAIAKGLAQKKTYNIALVMPGDCNLADMPFFQNSMQGIIAAASADDYDVMLVATIDGTSESLERILVNNKVDGVILSRSHVRDRNIPLLKAWDIPFVLMGTAGDRSVLQVDNDHRAGCSALVSHMLRGKTAGIGLIGGCSSYVVNRIRRQGFEDAFRKVGMTPDRSLIFEDCDRADTVAYAVEKLMHKRAACIVCMDDLICSVVLRVLAEKKILVPQQVRVASFYDSTLLQNSRPAVTSLVFDDKALGGLACKKLLQHIRGEKVERRTLLGYKLTVRESTEGVWYE